MLEVCDPYGWHVLDAAKMEEIRQKLRNFESMTWAEILIRGEKRNHRVSVNDLCKIAKNRLRDLRQDDIEELISLHLTATERVWGILENNILKILWWDPDHAVCPSLLKHT